MSSDLAAPGITHEQMFHITKAVDGICAAFVPVLTTTRRPRLLLAIQEQARTIAARHLGQALTPEQAAAIDLKAEGHLDQWLARAPKPPPL